MTLFALVLALAQEPPEPDFDAGYDGGFFIRGKSGKLTLEGLLQVNGVFFERDAAHDRHQSDADAVAEDRHRAEAVRHQRSEVHPRLAGEARSPHRRDRGAARTAEDRPLGLAVTRSARSVEPRPDPT